MEDWSSQDKRGTVRGAVDGISRESGFGNISSAAANALYGINHRGIGNPIPYNTDNYGLVFFTRPNLNLSYDNLAVDRRLMPLATKYTAPTMQRAIRTLLDPKGAAERQIESSLVDNDLPFMAVLTNHLLSLNGWPDPVMSYFNSKDGPMKESWSIIDDVSHNYSTWDLQASFRNIAGDPITLLFNSWLIYAAQVYVGRMMPYPECIIENEIDYQTRIFRIVLDPSRQYVQKIASTIAFPTSPALGAAMNFSNDMPFNQDNASQIQIPFHCMGVEYQDPILIREFNDVVSIFCPDMGAENTRQSSFKRLSRKVLNTFNYYGYPYIDPYTNELQWWVRNADYNALLSS